MDALEMTLLLDYYGGMLTDKQRDCFDMRHNQDLSDGSFASPDGGEYRLCPQRQGSPQGRPGDSRSGRKAGSLPRTRDGQPCQADYGRCPDTEGVSYGV